VRGKEQDSVRIDVVLAQSGHNAVRDGRLLDLDGEPDSPRQGREGVVERRHGCRRTPTDTVVGADERSVGSGADVELDVIGADLDRAPVGAEGVLGFVPAGAAVCDD
jgi:hypothetical protein